MLHRLTAVFDQEKTWERVINLDYLINFEPYADDNMMYIRFTMTNESFRFMYANIEHMMEDYQKLHTNMSQEFSQTQTVISPKEFFVD
jgi:hypothetical protein